MCLALNSPLRRDRRFHKNLRPSLAAQEIYSAICKEHGDAGPDIWRKNHKDMTVLYSDLEEKTNFTISGAQQGHGPSIVPTTCTVSTTSMAPEIPIPNFNVNK